MLLRYEKISEKSSKYKSSQTRFDQQGSTVEIVVYA